MNPWIGADRHLARELQSLECPAILPAAKEQKTMSKTQIKNLAKRIEEFLNAEIPGTTGPRVVYVAVPGSGTADLPRRARQVLAYLRKHQRSSSKALQAGLRVNRNVIAGALHSLRQAHAIRAVHAA
jgi:hypothetical protein